MMGMMTDLSVRQPAGLLTPIRRARWFGWLLLVAAVCTVGLYALESAHHHNTPTGELHCPVCQVMAHSALDVFTPQLKPLLSRIQVQFLAFRPPIVTAPRPVFTITHQSRAPPLV